MREGYRAAEVKSQLEAIGLKGEDCLAVVLLPDLVLFSWEHRITQEYTTTVRSHLALASIDFQNCWPEPSVRLMVGWLVVAATILLVICTAGAGLQNLKVT